MQPLTRQQQNMVTEHLGMVRPFVSRGRRRGVDVDDLRQHLVVHLMRAAVAWSAERGPFERLAQTCLKNGPSGFLARERQGVFGPNKYDRERLGIWTRPSVDSLERMREEIGFEPMGESEPPSLAHLDIQAVAQLARERSLRLMAKRGPSSPVLEPRDIDDTLRVELGQLEQKDVAAERGMTRQVVNRRMIRARALLAEMARVAA